MRIALLSDLHANLPALQAVEAHFSSAPREAERVWFMGDIVDRGAFPGEVMAWVRKHVAPDDWVLGNHEAVMMGLADDETISRVDPLCIRTMARQYRELSQQPDSQAFMQEFFTREKMTILQHSEDSTAYFLTHAGLKDPTGLNRYSYGWTSDVVLVSEFDQLERNCNELRLPGVLLYGHTHVPTLLAARREGEQWAIERIKVEPFTRYHLSPDRLWLINPGSVGSPRDLDWRASYAILDTQAHSVVFYRLHYDLEAAVDGLLYGRYDAELEKKLRYAPAHPDTPGEWLAHYARMCDRQEEA